MHRQSSLSTMVCVHRLQTTGRANEHSSFASWISGKVRNPLARHATTQTPQSKKKKKKNITDKKIHIKMQQALHIDACIKNMCNEDKASFM